MADQTKILGSAPPEPPLATVAGGGADDSSHRSPRRPRRSGSHDIIPGVRRVKGYPVTRDELFTLGGVGLVSSGSFSVGVNFLNRSFDLQKDLELNQGIPADIKVRWETREVDYWYFGVVLVVIGICIALAGGVKIWSIIHSTGHPDE